jgi:hypothetical protein
MPTMMQVVLAFAIAALVSITFVVMLAIQVVNTLAQIEGPPDTPGASAGRFDTERGTVE